MKREISGNRPWRVIIVGGGFGGLRAAQTLKSDLFDVTLIDRRNYHLYQPLLGQVAAGSLSPGQISAPLRSVLSKQKNTRVLLGSVEDIDADSKQVVLADGAVLPYDSLIVATGSQTSYFGNDEWQAWAPGLKNVEEATLVRHKILYVFEVAERVMDPVERREWLTFVLLRLGPLVSSSLEPPTNALIKLLFVTMMGTVALTATDIEIEQDSIRVEKETRRPTLDVEEC